MQKSSRVWTLIASLLLIPVFFLPFWKILLWAPQYPEWLTMKIWLSKLSGDIEIINGLNHYIGMKHIKEEMFPEFQIMPLVLGGLILFGLITAFWGKRILVLLFLFLLGIAGVAGLVDFYLWGYDYGHNLDPTAAIKVPGMVYQPPLIGTRELLNFVAYSVPDYGCWLLIISALTITGVVFYEFFKVKKSL